MQQIVKNPNFTAAIARFNQEVGTNFDFFDMYRVLDNAECMKHQNQDILPILKEEGETGRAFQAIKVIEGYAKLFYNEEQLRATATGFFNHTVSNIKAVTRDKTGVQWVFYSAHDTTVMNMLSRMNMASARCVY